MKDAPTENCPICNSGTLAVTNSTLSRNSALGDYGYGGGISNYSGTLTITNSTLSGNWAERGGGISSYYGSSVTVLNNTIAAGNAASYGPDIYCHLDLGVFSGSHNLIGNGWGQSAFVDGENGNPFFADYTDSLRAWDWCHPDYTVYNDRVKLASVICPGVPALYDEHIYFANLYKYCLRSAAARPIFFNVDVFHGDMVKPTPKQYRMLAEVLAVVADLNRRARDVTPQSLDEGRIYDWSDKLIGKVAADDTTLVAERNGAFTAVLLNDTDQPRTKGVTIDPSEFAARGKPFTLTAKLAPQTLRVLTGP